MNVPNHGIYIEDNPKIKNNRVSMDKDSLIKRLELGDRNVRFVPFGFKIRFQSSSDLARNPFVKALAGEEGAEKLAEVSENYECEPYVWSEDNIDRSIVSVAGLDPYWHFAYDVSLGIFGNRDGRNQDCGAFSAYNITKNVSA